MHTIKSKLIPAMVCGFVLIGASGAALAQDDGSERKTKETVAMSQQVYEKLAEAQELI
jgi:hypothetical protein